MKPTLLFHQTPEFHVDDRLLDLVIGARVVAGQLLHALNGDPTGGSGGDEEQVPAIENDQYLLFWLGLVATTQEVIRLVDDQIEATGSEQQSSDRPDMAIALRELLR